MKNIKPILILIIIITAFLLIQCSQENAQYEENGGQSVTTTTMMITTSTIDKTAPSSPVISGITSGSYNTNQSFTISGESEATIQYSLNNGSTWTTYNSQVAISIEGSYQIVAKQADTAGNTSSNSSVINIIIDKTAPNVPVISGITSGTFNANQSFTISGEDDATIDYSLDNGSSWQIYTSDVTLSDEGNYQILAKQIDKVGNVSSNTAVINVIIDKSAPSIPVISGITSGSYYTNQSFTISGETDTTIDYSVDNGSSWQIYTSEITLSDEGNYQILAKQIDKVGNVSSNTAVINVIIDKSAPSIPVISGITSGSYYTNQSFTISGETDTTIDYSVDNGSSWQIYTSEVTLSDEGNYQILAKQIDKVGNVSSNTAVINVIIDKSAPSIPVILGITSGSYNTNQSFTISGESEATIQYSLNNGSTWTTYNSQVAISIEGSYQIVAKQADTAGNTSSNSSVINIIIDKTAPNVPVISGITSGTFNANQSFTISGEDDATIDYSLDNGSSWQIYTSDVTLSDEGSYQILAKQRDKAGNVSGNIPVIKIYLLDHIFNLKWGSSGSGDGQFDIPFGITIDSSGYVYIVDCGNRNVQKFSANGVFITKWGSYGSGDGQFTSPNAIAVDTLDYVYVIDNGNDNVQKFSSNGVFITKWGSSGSGDGQFQNPHGICVDSSGNVYVVDDGNDNVQKFSSNGVFITKWGSSGSGDGQFQNPYGICVDSSGNVYIVDSYNDNIQKFSSDGTFIMKWGSSGSGDGQLRVSNGITIDPSGDVYVVDSYNDNIQKFSSDGTFITKWGSSGSGDGQFQDPWGITADSSGNIYVVDYENDNIQLFYKKNNVACTTISPLGGVYFSSQSVSINCLTENVEIRYTIDGTEPTESSYLYNTPINIPKGSIGIEIKARAYKTNLNPSSISYQKYFVVYDYLYNLKWGSSGSGDGQFNSPRGIAVDSSGNVYVADIGNDNVQKFSSDGTFIMKWGSNGSGDGQFDIPFGITIDSSDNVYVVDIGNDNVQKFSSDGTFIMKWGSNGSGDGQFTFACGIAVDSSGYVYIVDCGNRNVQKFSSDGTFIMKWGSYGYGDGQFQNPYGIAVDSSGNVYVTDSDIDNIQKFDSDGTFIIKWRYQVNSPYGITVDLLDNIYVVNNGNDNIQKFSSEGIFFTNWGGSGSGDGQFNSPFGITIDSSGNVYVVDDGNKNVQKFVRD